MQQRYSLQHILLVFWIGIGTANGANQLSGHPSPYLALHADDPVDWMPWQAEVLARARQHNRLIFVSVGYFSCHWCHVMQQESYQDKAVAKILNQHYVSVKVDRELDPDLDQRLINFVEKIRGSAGWPLHVFMTPDGYPVTGFNYLPRDNFIDLLQQLDTQWRQRQTDISAAAKSFFEDEMQDLENQAIVVPEVPAKKLGDAFIYQAMLVADQLQGGFGDTTKFPSVPQFNALMTHIENQQAVDPEITEFVQLSLEVMASRNLHDHVNGGFFRYTTDPDWQTPHFEKMLYDNAQLASLYLRAQQIWPDQAYAGIALRTLDFVEANLRHPAGGYMASRSAIDRQNQEGGAYFWNREQLAALLTAAEYEYLAAQWQLESKTSEFLPAPLIGLSVGGDAARNLKILHKLQTRGSASMPADDKRLASWNAMLLDALIDAADHGARFETRAQQLYREIKTQFFADGELMRFAGNATVANAVLEDYAQVAHAFYRYGQKFDHPEAIDIAVNLIAGAHRQFFQQDRWRQKAQPLIPTAPGKWIISDLVLHSPMSVWLRVALDAPGLAPAIRASAREMLQRASRELIDSPYFYGSFIMLRDSRLP